MSKVIPFAPDARRAASTPPQIGAPAAAVRDDGVSAPSRSAQSIVDDARAAAVKIMAEHGRRNAIDAARGDKGLIRTLIARQGEVMMLAGLQLMAECDTP